MLLASPPDFHLIDAFGRPISLGSLTRGHPGLIVFTASWCTPCIEGLQALQAFEERTHFPLQVLLVFIDPRETQGDLRAYQERYGFPTRWYYAKDPGTMALLYHVEYLDTKFLLAPGGVIRSVSLAPATYAFWSQTLAQVGGP